MKLNFCHNLKMIFRQLRARTVSSWIRCHQALHAFFHRGVCICLCIFFVFIVVFEFSKQFILWKYDGKCIIIPSQIEMISPKVFYLQSLALEVEGTGVVIQEMDPGTVNTKMTKVGFVVMPINIGDHDYDANRCWWSGWWYEYILMILMLMEIMMAMNISDPVGDGKKSWWW